MASPYISEIRLVSFNFAPSGWALCNGQVLPISQNQALFALLGITYGGDGRTNFALPNLQGRVPIHRSDTLALGQSGGEPAHTLLATELAAHAHPMMGSSTTASLVSPTGALLGTTAANVYGAGPPNTALAQTSVSNVGGSQPHENMAPYLVLNFIIALQGTFPPRA